MAYKYKNKKGTDYFLHSKEVTLRGGNTPRTIYFFAKNERDGSMDKMPEGYTIAENDRTGLPVLKKQNK